jgi:ABC-type nitrate/sulfonate/bicarbonate transport system substrate-binding protein
MPWEGLDAERESRSLTAFGLEEYDVPYGYTPLVLAHPDTIADRPAFLRRFLAASARGYRDAASDPERGVRALLDRTDLDRDEEFLVESQRRINEASLTPDGEWGDMDRERWDAFVSWLTDERLLTDRGGDPIPRGELDVDGFSTTRLLE